MKLRARALGLAVGTVWGLGVFVVTIWSASMERGKTLSVLAGYYFGYSVTFGGAFVGLLWGFVNGFVFGLAIAWLYSKFHDLIYKTDASEKPPLAERSAAVPTR
jgi:hypothetical protein